MGGSAAESALYDIQIIRSILVSVMLEISTVAKGPNGGPVKVDCNGRGGSDKHYVIIGPDS